MFSIQLIQWITQEHLFFSGVDTNRNDKKGKHFKPIFGRFCDESPIQRAVHAFIKLIVIRVSKRVLVLSPPPLTLSLLFVIVTVR